jgi:hypothetical protein
LLNLKISTFIFCELLIIYSLSLLRKVFISFSEGIILLISFQGAEATIQKEMEFTFLDLKYKNISFISKILSFLIVTFI